MRGEKRTHVGTACAAHWLGRKQQTLRSWACLEDGPIRPIRINGRLAWPVDAIRRLMGVEGIQ
ncbi:DNA-binding protein [Duganella sp. HSC-15S17]|uniref:DNA-binding protein n=1 Tax=Duganella violaceipulchra TaxID=2849652 RepID=A0AA41L649_9BURK|nr:DNA-binding protein [Duganella violaceicalia]